MPRFLIFYMDKSSSLSRSQDVKPIDLERSLSKVKYVAVPLVHIYTVEFSITTSIITILRTCFVMCALTVICGSVVIIGLR